MDIISVSSLFLCLYIVAVKKNKKTLPMRAEFCGRLSFIAYYTSFLK